jgi:hypothetical protein
MDIVNNEAAQYKKKLYAGTTKIKKIYESVIPKITANSPVGMIKNNQYGGEPSVNLKQ